MSGGSYDYIGFKIQDIYLRNSTNDPRRIAFQKLLKLVGKAMYDIEWVDSGDCGKGDEHESIDKVFEFLKADPMTIQKAAAFDSLQELFLSFKPRTEEKEK